MQKRFFVNFIHKKFKSSSSRSNDVLSGPAYLAVLDEAKKRQSAPTPPAVKASRAPKMETYKPRRLKKLLKNNGLPVKIENPREFLNFQTNTKLVFGKVKETNAPASMLFERDIYKNETAMLVNYKKLDKITSVQTGLKLSAFEKLKKFHCVGDAKIYYNKYNEKRKPNYGSIQLPSSNTALSSVTSEMKSILSNKSDFIFTNVNDELKRTLDKAKMESLKEYDESGPTKFFKIKNVKSHVLKEFDELDRSIADMYKFHLEYTRFNETLFCDDDLLAKYPLCDQSIIKHGYVLNDLEMRLLKEKFILSRYLEGSVQVPEPMIEHILYLTESIEQRDFKAQRKIKEITDKGIDGFNKYMDIIRNNGTMLHGCIEQYFSGVALNEVVVKNENVKNAWDSLKDILADIKPISYECNITHSNLFYTGRFDAVAYYKNQVCLIEWKMGDSKKRRDSMSDLYDYPIQLTAYMSAYLNSNRFLQRTNNDKDALLQRALIDATPMELLKTMVIYVYNDGSKPSVHELSFNQNLYYWELWLKRLKAFWLKIIKLNNESQP